MTTQDVNLALLLMLYSVMTHWEPMLATFDMLMEDFHAV